MWYVLGNTYHSLGIKNLGKSLGGYFYEEKYVFKGITSNDDWFNGWLW